MSSPALAKPANFMRPRQWGGRQSNPANLSSQIFSVTIKVIVADDHWAIRQALATVIAKCPGLSLVGEADDGLQALELVNSLRADLLVLDISLPHLRGLDVLVQIRQLGPLPRVLVFTMYPADPYAAMARQRGAQGFLSKEAHEERIQEAILTLADGRDYWPSAALGQRPGASGSGTAALDQLSRRESEVFKALIVGEPNKDIAARLGVSPKSITTYRDRLFTKLQVQSIAELCALAAHAGVL